MQSKVHGLGNTYENEEPEDFILVSFLPNLPLIFIVVPFVLSCPTGLLLYFILAFCSFGGGCGLSCLQTSFHSFSYCFWFSVTVAM